MDDRDAGRGALMGYYPIVVDMTGRTALVVGGGVVAERKVEQLIDVGARVTVISPALTRRLESWTREGRARHVARPYRQGDLLGYELVFVASDDGASNAAVTREARARRIWVNAADDPVHCDFILPSVLRRGDLVVAVATGGRSPALARAIREELESYFPGHYETLVQVAAEVRQELRARRVFPSAEAWRAALDAHLRRLIGDGKPGEARAYLLERLEARTCA